MLRIFAICFFYILNICSVSSQINTDVGGKVINGKSIYTLVIGNLLSKISYEQGAKFNDGTEILSHGFSTHLLDTSRYYRLWFNRVEESVLDGYEMYEYSGFPQFYLRSSGGDLVGSGKPFTYFSPLMEKGLIGIHNKNSQVIYVSGYMFLHDLKQILGEEFKLDMEKYVRLRYHNYSPSNIKVEHETDKNFLVSFYSTAMGKKYVVRIPCQGKDEIWEF